MFEATPFAVAMSPVVRVADPPGPRNDSAAKLAMVGVLTPGPVAMDLLTQVQIHRLDDVERTEYLVAWERAARWVEAQRMKAVVAVAGATATNRDDFAREHVKVALSGCGGSARADVDLARDMTGRLAAAGAALARGEISYSHARVLSTETFVLDDATAGQVAAAVLRRDEHRTPSQFRAAVRRAVIQADPVRAELAAERAAKERGWWPSRPLTVDSPGRRSGRAYPDRPGGRRGDHLDGRRRLRRPPRGGWRMTSGL